MAKYLYITFFIGIVILFSSIIFLTSKELTSRQSVTTDRSQAAENQCTEQVDIMLVLDRSQSMRYKYNGKSQYDWAKEAALQLINRVLTHPNLTARVGIASFGEQGNDGLGRGGRRYDSTLDSKLTSDIPTLTTAIANMPIARDATCIECGLRIANTELSTSSSKKIAILLSDGVANYLWEGIYTNNGSPSAIAAANAGRTLGITYYVMGYGIQKPGVIDETTLRAIAGVEERYAYRPNPSDWASTMLAFADDICPNPTPAVTINPTPSSTLPTNTPTATMTVTPTQTVGFQCPAVTFSHNGTPITSLTTIQPGWTITMVIAKPTGATKVRIIINEEAPIEVTQTNASGSFIYTYTIPNEVESLQLRTTLL